jgi:hypothetical protein
MLFCLGLRRGWLGVTDYDIWSLLTDWYQLKPRDVLTETLCFCFGERIEIPMAFYTLIPFAIMIRSCPQSSLMWSLHFTNLRTEFD